MRSNAPILSKIMICSSNRNYVKRISASRTCVVFLKVISQYIRYTVKVLYLVCSIFGVKIKLAFGKNKETE